jgi:hypothetical protein
MKLSDYEQVAGLVTAFAQEASSLFG